MARDRLSVGTFGEISSRQGANGRHRARVRYRDVDGRYRQLEASGASSAQAKRRLRTKMANVGDTLKSSAEITADTAFPDLVAYWLDGLEAEGELAPSTRERCRGPPCVVPSYWWCGIGRTEGFSTHGAP